MRFYFLKDARPGRRRPAGKSPSGKWSDLSRAAPISSPHYLLRVTHPWLRSSATQILGPTPVICYGAKRYRMDRLKLYGSFIIAIILMASCAGDPPLPIAALDCEEQPDGERICQGQTTPAKFCTYIAGTSSGAQCPSINPGDVICVKCDDNQQSCLAKLVAKFKDRDCTIRIQRQSTQCTRCPRGSPSFKDP